jgi:hypothetical protein
MNQFWRSIGLGGLATLVIAQWYYIRSSRDQKTICDKLSSELKIMILSPIFYSWRRPRPPKTASLFVNSRAGIRRDRNVLANNDRRAVLHIARHCGEPYMTWAKEQCPCFSA